MEIFGTAGEIIQTTKMKKGFKCTLLHSFFTLIPSKIVINDLDEDVGTTFTKQADPLSQAIIKY